MLGGGSLVAEAAPRRSQQIRRVGLTAFELPDVQRACETVEASGEIRFEGRHVDLRLASRKGDRTALSLALDRMRTMAHSPRYWEREMELILGNTESYLAGRPLRNLVDLEAGY